MAEGSTLEIVAQIENAPERQIEWMLRLGYELTVYARCFYETGTDEARGHELRGFNEIQHRVYGRTRVLQRGESWTVESFVGMIEDTSRHFGIDAEVQTAIRRSLVATNTIQ